MNFIYTTNECMKNRFISEGLIEIQCQTKINGKKAYCFAYKEDKNLTFSAYEKDKILFSKNLFL